MKSEKGRGLEYIDALPLDGERRLMLAVLLDALHTLACVRASPTPSARSAWWRERRWLHSDDQTHPFSFVNICHALGLGPDVVREGAMRSARRVPRYAACAEQSWNRLKKPSPHAIGEPVGSAPWIPGPCPKTGGVN